jgi:hypothetical protein
MCVAGAMISALVAASHYVKGALYEKRRRARLGFNSKKSLRRERIRRARFSREVKTSSDFLYDAIFCLCPAVCSRHFFLFILSKFN